MTTLDVYAAESDGWHSLADGSVIGSAPPPPVTTGFGFNLFNNYNGYTQGTAESSSTMLTRLVGDYGDFDWCKVFNSGFWPSTFSAGTQGEQNALNPATHIIACATWTHGSIASGSHDAAITTYAESIPAGMHVILCENEVDNHIGNNTDTTQWANYVADMDHLYDLLGGLTLDATVEVWDCFMEFTLESSTASTRQWRDFMTNPAKRHGIVWDNYWNQSTIDVSGNTQVGNITAKMIHLGMTRWAIGEHGDRRPVDSFTPSGNLGDNHPWSSDSARVTGMTTRINALLNADPAPEGIVVFDVVGTTGDHRIITMSAGGPDSLTKAMYADYFATARGA